MPFDDERLHYNNGKNKENQLTERKHQTAIIKQTAAIINNICFNQRANMLVVYLTKRLQESSTFCPMNDRLLYTAD